MSQINSTLIAISSDWTYNINLQIAEGDMVGTYVTWRCTHDRGSLGEIGPTGKKLVLNVMRFDRIVVSRIEESWFEDSFESFLKQIMESEEA